MRDEVASCRAFDAIALAHERMSNFIAIEQMSQDHRVSWVRRDWVEYLRDEWQKGRKKKWHFVTG